MESSQQEVCQMICTAQLTTPSSKGRTGLEKMNSVAKAELKHLPRGVRGSAQNLYRMLFYCYRMNSLGRNPQIVRSAAAAHAAALRTIRRWYPDFEPVME